MYPSFCLFLLAAIPSLADASRSSFSNSHARRSLALKHRDPQGGLLGGLGSVVSDLGTGLGGASTHLTSSVLPPSSTYVSASSTPTPACGGLFGPPCSSSSSTPSPSTTPALTTQGVTTPSPSTTPTSSCNGLLGLGLGCPVPSSNPTTSPAALPKLTSPSILPSSLCGGLIPCPASSSNPSVSSAASATDTGSASPSQSTTCDGLLGSGLGCPLPSSGLPVSSAVSASPSQSPSPSQSTTCDGLLGSGLGCPLPLSSSPVSSAASATDTGSASPSQSPSPSPSTACDGLLGSGLGCPPSSSMSSLIPSVVPSSIPSLIPSIVPSVIPSSQPSNSATPAPTVSCSGLDCPATSSIPASQSPSTSLTMSALSSIPSLSASPTTSCDILGVLGCTTLTPTGTTSWPSRLSTSLPTSTVISFPNHTTATMSQTLSSNATATTSFTPTDTSSSSISSNSNYNYLSTVSSLLLNSVSPTTSQTASGPDQAPTTHSLLSVAPTASPSALPLPSGLPQVILPQPPLNLNSLPSGYTLISILFNDSLNWEFVANNSDSVGQIFYYFPGVIATALGIDVAEVQNLDLIVYEPTSYTGPQDVAKLGTIWQGYTLIDKVSTLASLISNQKSSFYTAQSGSIPAMLAACVDPSLPLNAIAGPSAGGSSSTGSSSSSGSNVRQDAIIGVVSSLGAIAILIIAYVGYRAYKRRRALAHRRLPDNADNADYVGVRPEGQQFDQDSVGGQRRRSFYYAEDSLRGYQSTRADEDGYDHHVTNMRERPTRAVQPGTISTPILRESTMNW